MSGISVKIPLRISSKDGAYKLNKSYVESTKQNLKNLVLTAPGEKLTDPEFGVGVRNFLFENNATADGSDVLGEIAARISAQVARYMNYIVIKDIIDLTSDNVTLAFRINYKLKNFNVEDFLEVEFG